MADQVEAIVRDGIAAGKSDDEIRQLVKQHKERRASPPWGTWNAKDYGVVNPPVEIAKKWWQAGPAEVGRGVQDALAGNVARGGRQALRGGLVTAAPAAVPVVAAGLAAAPAATLAAVGGGLVGGTAASVGTDLALQESRLSEDQRGLVSDVAGLVGGGVGGTVAPAAMRAAGPPLRAAAAQAPAWIRQEVIKRGLQTMGMPGRLADVAGRVGTRVSGPAVASPAPASASAPAVAGPPILAGSSAAKSGAPSAPARSVPAHDTAGATLDLPWAARTTGQQSPQWIRNDLGIAAARAKVTLSEDQYRAAAELVKQGATPRHVVAELAQPATSSLEATLAALSPDEQRAVLGLLQAGKSPEEALAAIEAQRSLVTKTGATPLPKARGRVAERQTTGRWPKGTP
jgi:hypothetical protein